MLGIDERALRIVWTIFLFGLVLTLAFLIRDTLMTFALAIFFAYMLSPVVVLIERVIPKRRKLALAVVYVSLIGLLALAGFELLPRIAEQATSLATRLPGLLSANKLAKIPLPSWLDPARAQIVTFLTNQAAEIGGKVVPFVQQAGAHVLSGLSAALTLVLIPILGFFFLKDAAEIRTNLLGAVADRHDRGLLDVILSDVHEVLRSYIRALVLISVVSFVCWAIFLSVLGYPYDLLLAGLAGAMEFIPVVGPAAAGIVILTVGVASSSGSVLWVLVFWVVFRMFTDYVLNPYLMSSGVELHPLLVLFGVLAGERLGGIPGMFFSVPVLAILRTVFINLRTAYSHKKFTSDSVVRPADYRSSTGPQTLT